MSLCAIIQAENCLLAYSLKHCVVPENIHTPPTERFFWFESPPLGNFSLGSYFPLKIFVFKTPLPLRISSDPAVGTILMDRRGCVQFYKQLFFQM